MKQDMIVILDLGSTETVSYTHLDVYKRQAQRNVYIFLKPGSQGNMPPSPELRNAFGNIWIVEVFREPEAQHMACLLYTSRCV